MLRIVLPPIALASLSPVNVPVYVFVVVPVKIIVVVDIDVATVPIAIAPVPAPSAPSSGTQRDSRSPHQSRSWHVARIGIGIIRIFNGSRSVHHSRVIRRDVDNLRVRLLNCDHLLAAGNRLGLYHLLRAGF
jgi:hypothetical protein